jgi:6-methylpretetramide 4-monooxygenase / 4-hydroxy-6-methylpretetramide 12a-monooxygenase
VDDVAWAAPFRMHRRMVPRLADHRRFLLGDAGHLSSPFGGEGLNSGLHDAHNLAWKLALTHRGRARPSLLASFAPERAAADRHALEVSDDLHRLAHGAVESARTGVYPAPPAPERLAALVRARCMLDVSYAGTPLVGDYLAPGVPRPGGPAPGDRYPGRAGRSGTRHHLMVSGRADDAQLAQLRERWRGIIDISQAEADVGRPAEPGTSSAILVRPDGYVGFRATPAGRTGLEAIDSHLASYLVP